MTDADFMVTKGWESDVILHLQPEIAEALARTLHRYNQHEKSRGMPIDSGWEDLANALAAVGSSAR